MQGLAGAVAATIRRDGRPFARRLFVERLSELVAVERVVTSHSRRASCGRRPSLMSAPRTRGSYRRARQPSNVGELTGALVVQQRVDDEVEIAGEHVGQPVDREADPVIGDPVLFEVVGADLLAPAATADL